MKKQFYISLLMSFISVILLPLIKSSTSNKQWIALSLTQLIKHSVVR